jgi:hypothetical protein
MIRGLALVCGLTVVGLVVGLSASLTISPRSLGAARLTVPRCTSAGFGVINNLTGSNVVSVTVSSLPSACGGAAVQVAFNNGSTSSTGSGTVPAGGGSVTIALAAAVADTTFAQTDVLLTGP